MSQILNNIATLQYIDWSWWRKMPNKGNESNRLIKYYHVRIFLILDSVSLKGQEGNERNFIGGTSIETKWCILIIY